MKEPIVIIWSTLVILVGIWLRWSLKRQQRSFDRETPIHIFVLVLLSSLAGITFQMTMKDSLHIVWASRLAFFCIGILHVWSLYHRKWMKRDKFNYVKDSFQPELAFTIALALGCSIAFVLSPRLMGLLRIGGIKPDFTLWDAPLVFLLPFLLFKLGDIASQIPYRFVEKNWFYPQELVNADKIPWRDLIRVNFIVANSLMEEYRLFGRRAHPWIEVPRELTLDKVFCLMVQERRKKQGLAIIQDLGSEYGGEPQFWWLFRLKFVWWKPSTWRRKPRYLNPDLSIGANNIRGGDIIIAWRVPADKEMMPANRPWTGRVDFDPEKTTVINR